MTTRSRRIGWALIVAGVVGAVLQDRMNALGEPSRGVGSWFLTGLLALGCLFLISVGALIVARQPGNTIGWLLAGVGFLIEFWSFSQAYAPYALTTHPGSLPFGAVVGWVSNWVLPLLVSLFIPIFLLFPDGRPASPRWRSVVWAWGISTALSVATFGLNGPLIAFGSGTCPPHPGDKIACIQNPITDQAIRSVLGAISVVAGIVAALTAVAAVVSVIIRFRRARGDERQQIKWIVFVGVSFFATFVPTILLTDSITANAPEWVGTLLFSVFASILVIGLPLAIALAILKYHLYDLDVVIRKTVVVGAMALFITVVYAGIVALGTQLFNASKAGSFVAAAVLAIAFQPARERARRIADRLVYGRRSTPYEVLAEFSSRAGEAYATEDVLQRMAQVLAAGTGADAATVWLRTGGKTRPAGTAPTEASPPEELPEDAIEVSHQGEVLGALSVQMPASDPMDPAKLKLVEDLASQAGLVLRNVRLISELRASRQRLVAAQDDERRKIERNIHDGAQQQLVALSVKLRLLERMASKDPDRTAQMASELQADATEALEDLRDLARGIYPPLLADKGLAVALEAQARKAVVSTQVDAGGVGRYPPEVEATVYFSVLEALQNVAKYAEATEAIIRLAETDGALTFEVTDDGRGFDPETTGYGTGLQGIADRLDALGGTLGVRSARGAGTTVRGRVAATL